MALPKAAEEAVPAFVHHPGASLPVAEDGGNRLRLIAGEAWGPASPVTVSSPLFYADAILAPGGALPSPDGHEERAACVLDGEVEVSGDRFEPGRMLVFRAGDRMHLRAGSLGARVLPLGGAAMDGPRHLFWNFASSRERIEQAKAGWEAGRFGKVPGDEEAIPLPERRSVRAGSRPSEPGRVGEGSPTSWLVADRPKPSARVPDECPDRRHLAARNPMRTRTDCGAA